MYKSTTLSFSQYLAILLLAIALVYAQEVVTPNPQSHTEAEHIDTQSENPPTNNEISAENEHSTPQSPTIFTRTELQPNHLAEIYEETYKKAKGMFLYTFRVNH